MFLAIKHTRAATAKEWDTAWAGCDYATYFQSREWAEIWSAYSKGNCAPEGACASFSLTGTLRIWPLTRKALCRGMTSRYLSSPPTGTFGGWLSSAALTADHGQLLVEYLHRRIRRFTWQVNPYDPIASHLPLPGGIRDETQVLNLTEGLEALFRRWTKGHKSAVSKARREGINVHVAAKQREWEEYDAVYEDSLRRWGERVSSRYEIELFMEMYARKSASIRLWLASRGDRIVAGALCLYAGRHAVYWHGAALDEFFLTAGASSFTRRSSMPVGPAFRGSILIRVGVMRAWPRSREVLERFHCRAPFFAEPVP